jgi:hypothetical protein
VGAPAASNQSTNRSVWDNVIAALSPTNSSRADAATSQRTQATDAVAVSAAGALVASAAAPPGETPIRTSSADLEFRVDVPTELHEVATPADPGARDPNSFV